MMRLVAPGSTGNGVLAPNLRACQSQGFRAIEQQADSGHHVPVLSTYRLERASGRLGDETAPIQPERGTDGRSTCSTCGLTIRVLEVGFGPGFAIRELALRATDGFVCGIDHSEVMVRQATALTRATIKRGRVELRLASAADIGGFRDTFDKVLAVNNFGMWPDPQKRLNELLGALRPGGRVALVSQPRGPGVIAATT